VSVVHVLAEGQTEETFVRDVLGPHLERARIVADARVILTSSGHRGGVTTYRQVERDLKHWMAEDQRPDSRFTTMVDLYALPHDFPGRRNAALPTEPYGRVECLEAAFRAAVGSARFLPYVQLHEFEALLLADPVRVAEWLDPHGGAKLEKLVRAHGSPELVDEGKDTHPSKQIASVFPGYQKVSDGPVIADTIGIAAIRAACPHFDQWVTELEQLGTSG
jgi:hypothetical protein